MGGWVGWGGRGREGGLNELLYVHRKVEEKEAVGMSYCELGVGWVGGWVSGWMSRWVGGSFTCSSISRVGILPRNMQATVR